MPLCWGHYCIPKYFTSIKNKMDHQNPLQWRVVFCVLQCTNMVMNIKLTVQDHTIHQWCIGGDEAKHHTFLTLALNGVVRHTLHLLYSWGKTTAAEDGLNQAGLTWAVKLNGIYKKKREKCLWCTLFSLIWTDTTRNKIIRSCQYPDNILEQELIEFMKCYVYQYTSQWTISNTAVTRSSTC
jgi:hypothetical protein